MLLVTCFVFLAMVIHTGTFAVPKSRPPAFKPTKRRPVPEPVGVDVIVGEVVEVAVVVAVVPLSHNTLLICTKRNEIEYGNKIMKIDQHIYIDKFKLKSII